MTSSEARKETYELTREQLLAYIEIDLWNRFEKRLWGTVAVFLTVVTVAGLFGLPYFIRTEVERQLAQGASTFERKAADLLTHAKLLAILSIKQDRAAGKLRSDILRLLRALDDMDSSGSKGTNADQRHLRISLLRAELESLVSKETGDPLFSDFSRFQVVTQEEAKWPVLPPKLAPVEIETGQATKPHPVHDGTLGGALRDIKFQATVFEALVRSVDRVREKLFEFGSSGSTYDRIESVKVGILEKDLFTPFLPPALDAASKKALKADEAEVFKAQLSLYLRGFDLPTVEVPIGLGQGVAPKP